MVEQGSIARSHALRWFLLCCVPSACSAPAIDQEVAPIEVEATREAVVGGDVVEACQWPSTVSVNGWGACSGTLIHPRIVTTAAHCLSNDQATIYFGAGKGAPGAFSLKATCKAGAEGTRGANTNKDWGYCVLPEDERVKLIPITAPLVGCEAERFLKAGMSAWVVGYGATSSAGGGAGVKRAVAVTINALDKTSAGTIDVGDAAEGACHGDSGGPLYVHLVDGAHDYGYRVVGSTSGAGERSCDCSCSTVYVNMANHVQAIEANENIDVTPCTNAQGGFERGPSCDAFLAAPQTGTGTFPACHLTHTSEPIDSCNVLAAGSALPAAGSGALANLGSADPALAAGTGSLAFGLTSAGNGGPPESSGCAAISGKARSSGSAGLALWAGVCALALRVRRRRAR